MTHSDQHREYAIAHNKILKLYGPKTIVLMAIRLYYFFFVVYEDDEMFSGMTSSEQFQIINNILRLKHFSINHEKYTGFAHINAKAYIISLLKKGYSVFLLHPPDNQYLTICDKKWIPPSATRIDIPNKHVIDQIYIPYQMTDSLRTEIQLAVIERKARPGGEFYHDAQRSFMNESFNLRVF